MNLSEKQIQIQIIEMLNYHGCFVFRMNSGMIPIESEIYGKRMVKLGRKGTSDIIGVYKSKSGKGIFCAFEVKTPARRNNVSFYQEQFLEMVREYGGIASVVTSPEEAIEILNMYEKGLL